MPPKPWLAGTVDGAPVLRVVVLPVEVAAGIRDPHGEHVAADVQRGRRVEGEGRVAHVVPPDELPVHEDLGAQADRLELQLPAQRPVLARREQGRRQVELAPPPAHAHVIAGQRIV
jgi:hypothetical protein